MGPINKVFGREKRTLIDKTDSLDMKNLRSNTPEYIVLHSTYNHKDFSGLLDFHRNRGFAGVGYHMFVSSSAKRYNARPFNLEGAHALGFNFNSIGLGFYSNEGKISKKSMQSIEKTIEEIEEFYPNIKKISHTQAQLMYLNRLLEKENIDLKFPTDDDVVLQENFEKIKRDVDSYLNLFERIGNPSIDSQIKKLKNCPGEIFKRLK